MKSQRLFVSSSAFKSVNYVKVAICEERLRRR